MRHLFLALIALVTLHGCSRSNDPGTPDAIFMIVVDTLRPDRLSCYGYEAIATPNIDELARRGVTFTRAQSVASWTIPSMGSMMTSLFPTQLGLVETPVKEGQRFGWQSKRDQENGTLAQAEVTLAEVFSELGYHTAGFVNQPGLTANDGFMQGFEDWYYPASVEKVVRFEPGTELRPQKWTPFLRESYKIDVALIGRFETWVAENSDKPMFVWLHLLTPHAPYNPKGEFAPRTARRRTLEGHSKRYDGEVRAVDDMVGRILAAIVDNVGLERSLVILTSDHGEALGDHGMNEHGHSLHREVIHVPLIVMSPGLGVGKRVDRYVRTIDIFPTALDVAGRLDAVPSHALGTSLVPMIGTRSDHLPVFSEAMLYGSTERSVITDGYKLMFDEQEGRYALYDTAKDPGELNDLSESERERTEELRAVLDETYHELVTDYLSRADDRSPASAEEAARMREALRALGYINE